MKKISSVITITILTIFLFSSSSLFAKQEKENNIEQSNPKKKKKKQKKDKKNKKNKLKNTKDEVPEGNINGY